VRRFLLDQGLAPQAAAILREEGFDAVHVSEIGMARSDDAAIMARAAADQRVCVTFDQDFHAHLAIAGSGSPSVIFLRVQGLGAQAQAEFIQMVCRRCGQALQDGAAVSANRKAIRIRRLPLR
jgi:predicted nuclease of predicted toxin-antitoxin system